MPRRPSWPAPRPELVSLLQTAKQPAEDATTRLIVADWLEEHGGPDDLARAAFIRLQMRVAGLGETDPGLRALRDEERELLAAHGPAWRGPLEACKDDCRFERGLLSMD